MKKFIILGSLVVANLQATGFREEVESPLSLHVLRSAGSQGWTETQVENLSRTIGDEYIRKEIESCVKHLIKDDRWKRNPDIEPLIITLGEIEEDVQRRKIISILLEDVARD